MICETQKASTNRSTVVVNALGPQFHKGLEPSRYGRPGRIPGSRNVPAATLVKASDKTLTTPAQPLDAVRQGVLQVLAKRGAGVGSRFTGTVQGGAWKGWLHSGCSVVARPDGSAATVGKFKQADLVVFDIPAE